MQITPQTKIAELLKEFPQLESTLIKLSPTFSALKNPVLRRTVARVTSLQQAAKVGNISLVEMVDTLRLEVGQPPLKDAIIENDEIINIIKMNENIPENITHRFDAVPLINAGEHPKDEIIAMANSLQTGDCMELLTPFPPAPLIQIFKNSGFSVTMLEPKDGITRTYINNSGQSVS